VAIETSTSWRTNISLPVSSPSARSIEAFDLEDALSHWLFLAFEHDELFDHASQSPNSPLASISALDT
jgi:hypothetical protein